MLNILLDALFPMTCVRCHAEGHAWCEPAGQLPPWPLCFWCRRPYHPQTPTKRCRQSLPLITIGPYADPALRTLLYQWKYADSWAVSTDWARLLAARVAPPAALVAIPLHWRRRLARGYNQADVLARQLGGQLNQPICQLLIRQKPTRPQAQLDDQARRANLAQAFVFTPMVDLPRQVWLVDDIITSGATIREALVTLRPHTIVLGLIAVAYARTDEIQADSVILEPDAKPLQ